MQFPLKRAGSILTLLLIPVVLGSCASTKKKLEQATELELEGRYLDAAYKYLDILDDDKSEIALAGFNDTSEKAIEGLMREAARLGDDGQFLEAAENFFEIDKLDDKASEAGVALILPSDYSEDRRSAFDDGITFLSNRAERRLGSGDFKDAISDYSEIIDDFDPNDSQFESASDGRITSHVRWAETEMDRNRYRSALEQAEIAVELMGNPDHRLAATAATIRRSALERGTIFTAIIPIWKVGELERVIDADLIDELNDGLQLDHWNTPPLFLAIADQSLVRREVRRVGYRRAAITRKAAGEVANNVDADLAVFGLFEEFEVKEHDVKERVKTVELRAGGDTTYVEIKGKIRYDAEIIFTIVNDQGRVIREGSVSHRENGRFERGYYEGEMRDLKLNRGQRKLFDEQRQREELLEIEDELARELAIKYAKEVYEDLLREVQ